GELALRTRRERPQFMRARVNLVCREDVVDDRHGTHRIADLQRGPCMAKGPVRLAKRGKLFSPVQLDFLRGTLAPFFRASERPIAMACSRLVTRPPLPPFPERNVPRFSRCSARSTLLLAALPYLAMTPPELRMPREMGAGNTVWP